ncbi:MAG: hypothetical protein JW892_08815 [Anaerolineae bacterium]|nr:hypothetical protein [Anaerolineae bacterium]
MENTERITAINPRADTEAVACQFHIAELALCQVANLVGKQREVAVPILVGDVAVLPATYIVHSQHLVAISKKCFRQV